MAMVLLTENLISDDEKLRVSVERDACQMWNEYLTFSAPWQDIIDSYTRLGFNAATVAVALDLALDNIRADTFA